jgi:hypothetical protein
MEIKTAMKTITATQIEADYYNVKRNGKLIAGVCFDTLNQNFIAPGHVVFVQTLGGDVTRYN